MSSTDYTVSKKEWSVDTAPGTANLYSFPFWLIIDEKSPPVTQEIIVKDKRYRIYAPFRSAPANFTGMPEIKASMIPFTHGTKPNIGENTRMLTLAATPGLAIGDEKPRMVLNWGEKGSETVISLAMDSMRIDWFRGDDEQNIEKLLRAIFDQLRWMSKQWWIGHSVEGLSGYLRNQIAIKKNGQPVDDPIGRTKGYGVGTDVMPITNMMWKTAFKNISTDFFPPSHELLLLDAQHSLAINDYRTFIVRAATACEQAIDFHFERIWKIHKSEKYRKGKICTGYEIDRHISEDLENFISKSFKISDPTSFALIANLWDARGNVAHGKAAVYRQDGEIKDMSLDMGNSIMLAAKKLLLWLENLI